VNRHVCGLLTYSNCVDIVQSTAYAVEMDVSVVQINVGAVAFIVWAVEFNVGAFMSFVSSNVLSCVGAGLF